MSFFDRRVISRMTDLEVQLVHRIVKTLTIDGFEPKYENVSHFVRCAVNRLAREEEFMLKKSLRENKNGKYTRSIGK